MGKVLAVNVNGEMTWCAAPPEKRGVGKCNHVDHQRANESAEEFCERMEDRMEALKNGQPSVVLQEGDHLTTEPYHITDEEAEQMVRVTGKKQLLEDHPEGAYVEVDQEALWNDMDKKYFSQQFGMSVANVNAVLHGEKAVVISSDDPKHPVGQVVSLDRAKSLEDQDVIAGTGVEFMNAYAEQVGYQATKRVYVLPYYLRPNANGDVEHEYTKAYKYLMRNHNDPDAQQLAYEALLDNQNAKKQTKYKGFVARSLADEFKGKSGVFRGQMSGRTIPYSGRAVLTPNENLAYDEVGIPPSVAVDIFKPVLQEQFKEDGFTKEDWDEYVAMMKRPQSQVPMEYALDLSKRLARGNARVIINRQPSLHYASLQSYRPKVSMRQGGEGGDATVQVNPICFKNYNADVDGDTMSIIGINPNKAESVGMTPDEIVAALDGSTGAKQRVNTQVPRFMEQSAIKPTKDAMWGLVNLLSIRDQIQ